MKPSIQTLGQILYSPSQYVIPVFQRNYRWETPQWQKLWTSLIEIQRPDKRGNHFMGFLVVVPGLAQPGHHTTFHLIDGQQRITTASILLGAVRNVARQLGHAELADEIHQYYLTHPLKKGEQHFRLLPKEHDHDSYLALVASKGEVTGRVGDALAFFEEKLTAHCGDSASKLREVFDTLCQKLEFMFATLEAENAYNIFKSLNSTGVPLGQSDLIRNFVFMHVLPDEHDDFDRDLWRPLEECFIGSDAVLDEDRFSKFFRDFLMSSGRYISPKETFQEFESRYEATKFVANQLAADLLTSAKHYQIITGGQHDEDADVTRALAGLNAFESATAYPILLALFKKRVAKEIDSGVLAKCIRMLSGFIVRRFICGESSRGYGQMFVRALTGEAGTVDVRLETYLLERGWPDDIQFKKSFCEFPIYQRAYAREILEFLESGREHREPADLSATQVEHVMPQTLNDDWIEHLGGDAARTHAEWLHRIGNLTLSAYNLPLWNHKFDIKRGHYFNSNIVITRELAGYQQWTAKEIQERGELLANEAVKIWTGPEVARVVPEVDTDAEDDAPGRQELRRRFWTGLNDYLVSEYPELPDIEARPSWQIRLPSGIRHIGFELIFNLRRDYVGIDVWFWREASRPLWEEIKTDPAAYNSLIEATWEFEPIEGRQRARMFVNLDVDDLRQERAWPAAFEWFGEKLTALYGQVAPRLRNDMSRREAS